MQEDCVVGTKRPRPETTREEESTHEETSMSTFAFSAKRTKSNVGPVTVARINDRTRDLLNAYSMLHNVILTWINSMDTFPFEDFSISEVVSELYAQWPALRHVIWMFTEKTFVAAHTDPNVFTRFRGWSTLLGVIFECNVCIFCITTVTNSI